MTDSDVTRRDFVDLETQKKKRTRPTVETHVAKIDALVKLLDDEIERKGKEGERGGKVLRTVRKQMVNLQKDVPKLSRTRRVGSTKNKVSGFVLKCNIHDKLADFLQVPRGTTLSRTEILNGIHVYIHLKPDEDRPQILRWAYLNPDGKRNLQDSQNKRVVIPDDALADILDYKQYQLDVANQRVTKKTRDKKTGVEHIETVKTNELGYWIIPRLISHQIISTIKYVKDTTVSP
jgi:chromatin remodeling complex protein RSC6